MRSLTQRLAICLVLMVGITGFATVAAADGAETSSKQLGSIDVSLEDKHASIDEIEISSQTLPTVEIDEREYVRKGLKDQLALSDDPEAEELRQEVGELEQRIEDLTEFTPRTSVGTQS